ncbi:MAG: four helix bundle protein [Verrucomicrobiota bacterium]
MNSEPPNQDLRSRTKQYALRVIRLYTRLPKSTEAQVLGRQLLRSGTSPGAQYREACRAKSDADFISKIEGALQELDESDYWLDLLGETKLVPTDELEHLRDETNQLIAIFVSMVRKTKNRKT